MSAPMPRRRVLALTAALTALLAALLTALLAVLLVTPAPAAAAAWRWPLDTRQIAERFSFDQGDRYRRGAHRGVTLRGAGGSEVKAVCSGTVSFSGRLPDRRRAVTLQCGRLAATEIGLSVATVRSGQRLLAGQSLGRLGSDGLLQVGARLQRRRDGYLDPLPLFAAVPTTPVLAPLAPRAPRGGAARRGPRAALRAPLRPAPQSAALTLWLLGAAWLGLGAAATAIGAGIALRGRRAARSQPHAPLARAAPRR